jgi:hypothetical protein
MQIDQVKRCAVSASSFIILDPSISVLVKSNAVK